jgi:pilus assembly protein CpaF
MFTIIISEKGGAERREGFDRNEINVGRVQGNDLMLPKGNVSKHHARLLYRDGRFIVTDLKSTNGTYVNGRKISQATIVREGDKIYIGDFVLRLETGQPGQAGQVGQAGQPAPALQQPSTYEFSADDSAVRAPGGRNPVSPVLRDGGAPSVPPADAPTGVPPPPGNMFGGAGSFSAPPASPGPQQNVSHFPLERDPDSESAPDLLQGGVSMPRVPGPPRLPQAEARPRATTAMLGGVALPATPPRAPSRPTPEQTAHRKALIALVDRVTDALQLDAEALGADPGEELVQRIDATAREQAKAMRDEGEAPEAVELDPLVRDALRELVGLGPLGPLLEDDHVVEVHVPRPDSVLAVRDGHASIADPSFTSEAALVRAIARLAHQGGQPLRADESIVERRLSRGATMTAVAPPLSSGWAVSIRKPVRTEASLEDHVRVGAVSRSMAALFEACVAARANVLVVGAAPGLVSTMLGALASLAGPGERIVVLTELEEIHVPHAYVTRMASVGGEASREESLLRTAAHLRPDRLIVGSVAGGLAGAVVDVIGEGLEGVIAGVTSSSLRHALARLAVHVGLGRPGTSMELAREGLGEAFDVAIEMVRSLDGRVRVARVAELAGADASGVVVRDLFVSNADGTGEGGFVATGIAPRFVQDFAARGVRLDPALFKRR